MSTAINQHLIDNISLILKKSLAADATLSDLRAKKQAQFNAIFKKDAGFTCTADTFQPYVEEVADELLEWQNSQSEELLVRLVKKIELLLKMLASFEKSHSI